MVNRGEEKVRVHMNVVPRSTKNTNDETEAVRDAGPVAVNVRIYVMEKKETREKRLTDSRLEG